MASFVAEARELLHPGRESDHGPLGSLLLCLTFTAGLVDAFSYLVLGHVFVGNQTGNFILLGVALAGARGFSASAQVTSLVSFAIGATVGGRISGGRSRHRGKYLFATAMAEVVLLAVGAVLGSLTNNPPTSAYRYGLIFTLAIAMGIQTATARKLAVPDVTTTTFTQLITATFIDSALGGGKGSRVGRRVLPFIALLSGAVVSTLFVIDGHIAVVVLLAALVVGMVVVITGFLRRSNAHWPSYSPS
jgi:uncharacterized membrane protein YoaK (UPF0700 family)